ncbi:2-amino-4-hydroxy-6-hydroxymethyldihydropteridine diphosphokinase [Enterococcus avium]
MYAYLGLGSNIGNKIDYIKNAVFLIEQVPQITIEKKSSFYETEPYGYYKQEKFINSVILVETSFNPLRLLKILNEIENRLERTREIHWGPRTIDIDILLFENVKFTTERLTIPHKDFQNRAFVLVPLQEIFIKNDLFELDIDNLLEGNEDIKTIKKLKESW